MAQLMGTLMDQHQVHAHLGVTSDLVVPGCILPLLLQPHNTSIPMCATLHLLGEQLLCTWGGVP